LTPFIDHLPTLQSPIGDAYLAEAYAAEAYLDVQRLKDSFRSTCPCVGFLWFEHFSSELDQVNSDKGQVDLKEIRLNCPGNIDSGLLEPKTVRAAYWMRQGAWARVCAARLLEHAPVCSM